MVLLTRNEASNVASVLEALAHQHENRFEIIVLDAASADATVDIVRDTAPRLPMPVRLEVAPEPTRIADARNRGVALARAPRVAFLSADTRPATDWTRETLRALETNDMAYGLQVHAPRAPGIAPAVRGLRYHFPRDPSPDPLPYASNVAAGYRKAVLVALPFEPGEDAAEDLLLARRAASAGFRIAYEPRMVVHHHDVATLRAEWRKCVREGFATGRHAGELAIQTGWLAWGAVLVLGLAAIPFWPVPAALALALVVVAPALRRAWRRRHAMPGRAILLGVLASPPFDVAFLVQYVHGLASIRRDRRTTHPDPPGTLPDTKETHP